MYERLAKEHRGSPEAATATLVVARVYENMGDYEKALADFMTADSAVAMFRTKISLPKGLTKAKNLNQARSARSSSEIKIGRSSTKMDQKLIYHQEFSIEFVYFKIYYILSKIDFT